MIKAKKAEAALVEHEAEHCVDPPTFVVVAVPDDTPVPEYHSEMVAQVLR